MKAAALISVEEYLRTTYEPDCDYVDGELVERNVGELEHSGLQTEIVYCFRSQRRAWKVHAYVAQRVQVKSTRFRVPDVCVVRAPKPTEPVFRMPPFICIEVLSKKDSLENIQSKIDDYLNFGVPYVWVINPRTRRAWVYTADAIVEAKDGILRTENPAIVVPLADLFAGLDEAL